MARTGRILFRGALLVAGVWMAWSAVNWYAGAPADEPKGACARNETMRCAVCKLIGRNDCRERPLAGCPATAMEYVASFPDFKAKLAQQRATIDRWTAFRKEMETIQNRSSNELCRGNLDRMKKVETEIPLAAACPSEAGGASRSTPSTGASDNEVSMLVRFRDCSDAKAKELSATIKRRQSLRVGEETAQLHSMLKETTKVTTDSIELLTQFREVANQAMQVKCWLRGRISDCAL